MIISDFENNHGGRMFAFLLLAEKEEHVFLRESGSTLSEFFGMETVPSTTSRQIVSIAQIVLYQLRKVAKIYPLLLPCIFEEILTPKPWENFTMHLSRKFEAIII